MSDDARKTLEGRVEESRRLLEEFRIEIIKEASQLYSSEMDRLIASVPETIDQYLQQVEIETRQKIAHIEDSVGQAVKQRDMDLQTMNAEMERQENVQRRALEGLERSLRAQESVLWLLGILTLVLAAALILLALKTLST